MRSRWVPAALGALALLSLVLGARVILRPAPPEPDPTPRASPAARPRDADPTPSPRPRPAPGRAAPDGAEPGRERAAGEADGETGEDPRVLWEKRLERARHTLQSYLDSTRYPPESRPAREHPDQMEPHHVAPVTLPLAREDRKLTDAKVTLRQDRFFLIGDERVTLTVACEDSDGPAPCAVVSSTAGIAPSERARVPAGPPDVPVPFTSAGQEGVLTATFEPAAAGFGGFHGTIRISLALQVDLESGGAAFDVQYTPAAPAAFTGKVREALQDGSLDLFVEMQVDEPGRYVLAARADDARGRTFAYLSFNEELPRGRQEARLRLFGKLVRDEGAEPPFRLRDVEGYLLKADTHPDRELMTAMEGAVHTTRRYRASDFSESTWESEDKARHVEEFTKDVELAEKKLEGLIR